MSDEQWEDRLDDARRDQPARVKVFRCGDRTCGAPDCASCYGEQAAREYVASEQEAECRKGWESAENEPA